MDIKSNNKNISNTIAHAMVFVVISISCFINSCNQKEKAKTDTAHIGQIKNEIIVTDSLIRYYQDKHDTTKLLQQLALQIKNAVLAKDTPTIIGSHLLRYKLNEYNSVKNVEMKADLDTIISFATLNPTDSLSKKNIGAALVYRGYHYSQDGNYEKAVELQGQYLVSPYLAYQKPATTSWVYQEIGDNCMRFGDYLKGIKYLQEKNKFDENSLTDPQDKITQAAKAAVSMSTGYVNLGLPDSAIHIASNALAKSGVLLSESAYLHANLADAFATHNEMTKAKQQIGIAKNEILKIEDYNKYATLLNLEAGIFNKENNFIGSNTILNKALIVMEHTDNTKRDHAKIYALMADNFIALKNSDSAIFYANRTLEKLTTLSNIKDTTLPNIKQLYAENTFLDVFETKIFYFTSRFTETNDPAYLKKIIECCKQSILIEQKLIGNFSYDQSKFTILQESRAKSALAIRYCDQLFSITKDQTWIEQAFSFAEANKAIVLLQSLQQNQKANTNLQNDTSYTRYKYLFTELSKTESDILELNEKEDQQAKQKLLNAKDSIEKLLLFAEAALLQKNPGFKKIDLFEEKNLIPDIQDMLLQPKAQMLTYFNTDSLTYLFILGKHQKLQLFTINNLIRDPIKKLLSYFETPAAINNDPKGYANSAFEVYSLLGLNKINKETDELIIIPDDIINFIPFDALLSGNPGNNNNIQSWPFLVNQYNIAIGYSANSLLLHASNKPYDTKDIIAFAPIERFNNKRLADLKYTGDEINATLKWKQGALLFKHDQATIRNFYANASSADIIHIATHASVNNENESSKIEFIDSSIYLQEIYALKLKANLVVLSACETGLGKLQISEGAMSLARGFYYAGARNVITSLWSVDDASTAQLFKNFYSVLKDKNYARTLRTAKLDYIKNASVSSSSPYYWAGFVTIGYERPESKFHFYWYLDIAAIIILILILMLIIKRRKKIKATFNL